MLINELNGNDADNTWEHPIMLLSDSQSAVTIINSDRDIKSLRHCKRRLFYFRQVTKENEIKVEFITSDNMVADGGTKNLDSTGVDIINKLLMVSVAD